MNQHALPLSASSTAPLLQQKKSTLALPQKSRWLVYSLFLIVNIAISLDHGSIPASTAQLRKVVRSDQAIGLFGSLVFVGNIIGSLISFWVINFFNRKTLLVFSLFFIAICLFTFVLFRNLLFLLVNRILVGIFQSYITIYLPVWCHQFGIIKQKALMISYAQIVVPIGVFLGYLFATIFIQLDILGGWNFAFVIQGLLVVVLGIMISFVPSVYFDSQLHSYLIEGVDETFFSAGDLSSNVGNLNHMNVYEMFSDIISEKVFLISVLALSALCYVITGVQYWVSDYMQGVLFIKKGGQRLLYFTLVCFTSPTLGVFIGGHISNKIGGYEEKESIIFCLICGIIASVFAFFVPLLSNIFLFVMFLWIVLFFGAAILPSITGIIISTLPRKLTASGNSITNLMTNMFGYLPAPYIYGMLTDIFHDKGIVGMRFTMWFSFVGVVLLAFACKYRYKNNDEDNVNTAHLILLSKSPDRDEYVEGKERLL